MQEHASIEILGKTNIDFMGKCKIAFVFSGIMMALGVLAMVQIARGEANLGIYFAGGTAVQLKFDQPIRTDAARAALDRNNLHGAEIQELMSENKLLIRVKAATTIEEKVADRVVAIFGKEFPDRKLEVEASTEIGPTIGHKLQEDALIAILISFAGIILYIAARFEFRFGVAAAVSTFHDVLAVLGLFYVDELEPEEEMEGICESCKLAATGQVSTDEVEP